MPQETDTITGSFILPQDARLDPQPIVLHRSAVATADGAGKPASNDARWLANPGYRTKARVFVSSTGTPATCTIRPYLRSGGATGLVGANAAQSLAGTPNYDAFFDVQSDGDDLLCLVETLSGGTSPTIFISVSWR